VRSWQPRSIECLAFRQTASLFTGSPRFARDDTVLLWAVSRKTQHTIWQYDPIAKQKPPLLLSFKGGWRLVTIQNGNCALIQYIRVPPTCDYGWSNFSSALWTPFCKGLLHPVDKNSYRHIYYITNSILKQRKNLSFSSYFSTAKKILYFMRFYHNI